MKHVLLILLLTAGLHASAQTYITNVTLVDVEKQQLVRGRTVILSGRTITSVQGATKVPANAKVIDGTGKYLMPGMTDAHVHFFQSGGLYTRPDAIDLRNVKPYDREIAWVHAHMEEQLRRYLRTGITNVIDVGATYNFLRQRDALASRTDLPTVFMTGPLLTTFEPPAYMGLKEDEPFHLITSPDDARAMVQAQLPFRPDFIKIWYIVKRDSFEAVAMRSLPLVKAVIDEAHKYRLKVAVHATERFTAQLAVESGCDFLVHSIDDEVVSDELIRKMKDAKVILCPTLVVHDGYFRTFRQTHEFPFYDLTMSDPFQLGSLGDLRHLPVSESTARVKKGYASEATASRFHRMDSVSMINLKKLSDAGITIAAGTDAGNIGTMHASSYLAELRMMQQSGMPAWKVLQAATINGAKILGREKMSGSIAPGKEASMLLLDSNPVASIDNLERISLVISKGDVLDPDTLVKETPEALVQRQLNAYNARNLEAFLEPYADDVELFNYPDKPVGKGKGDMRRRYGDMFAKNPALHCEVTGRIVQGNIVIDKESVEVHGDEKIHATAIYEIVNNKIKKVTFIR